MSRVANRAGLAVALVGGWVTGCGDSDDGGSGVSGDTLLVELTTRENTQLCQYYEKRYKSYLGTAEQYCTAVGLDSATDAATCEQVKNDCIAFNDLQVEMTRDWGCERQGLITEPIEGPCTATVADIEDCLREAVKEQTGIGKTYTCQRAGGDLDQGQYAGLDCAKVFDSCPGVEF
jgi:hypothetical protein